MGWRWTAITGCWLIWGLLYASRLRLVVPDIDWGRALWYSMPDALLWAALTPLPVYLTRRFPPTREGWRRALGPHLTGALCVVVVHPVLDAGINVLAGAAQFENIFFHLVRHSVHLNLMIYLTIVGITHFLVRGRHLREREHQASELRAQLTQARLDALQTQLRPHFLFNTLNTVSGLMERDVDTGRRVLRQLGDVLRMCLERRERQEVSLGQELELVRAYLEIEQTRFGDRMAVKVEVPPELFPLAVPVFAVQLLVENAITHGISRRMHGGSIEVSGRRNGARLEVEIRDNGGGEGAAAGDAGQGIGLSNTRARLEELYPGDHSFTARANEDGGWTVAFSIPAKLLDGDVRRSA